MNAFHVLFIAGVLASTSAGAQEQETANQDIIVKGNREPADVAEAAQALARDIGANIDLLRPIPRFNDPLCLDVSGLKEEYIQRFANRINENVRRANIPIAPAGCRPNAMVMFADDSRRQIVALRKRNRFLFGEMPRYLFEEMLASRDQVYAWQVNEVDGLGMSFDRNGAFGNGPAVNRSLEVGRLNPPIRMVTRSSVVVIEKSRTVAKTPEQLADYATMRLVAPSAEVPVESAGVPTIMTLFADPDNAPDGLTTFDAAYLDSVYRNRANGPPGRAFVETGQLVAAAEAKEDDAP
jgi:hypothetical protein